MKAVKTKGQSFSIYKEIKTDCLATPSTIQAYSTKRLTVIFNLGIDIHSICSHRDSKETVVMFSFWTFGAVQAVCFQRAHQLFE